MSLYILSVSEYINMPLTIFICIFDLIQVSYACVGKSSWPELVGVQGTVAEATIERENPLVNAVIVPEGSSVILDFRCDRVWVWVDKNGLVDKVPKIG
jgi:hypothetical protein